MEAAYVGRRMMRSRDMAPHPTRGRTPPIGVGMPSFCVSPASMLGGRSGSKGPLRNRLLTAGSGEERMGCVQRWPAQCRLS